MTVLSIQEEFSGFNDCGNATVEEETLEENPAAIWHKSVMGPPSQSYDAVVAQVELLKLQEADLNRKIHCQLDDTIDLNNKDDDLAEVKDLNSTVPINVRIAIEDGLDQFAN